MAIRRSANFITATRMCFFPLSIVAAVVVYHSGILVDCVLCCTANQRKNMHKCSTRKFIIERWKQMHTLVQSIQTMIMTASK